MARFTPFNHSCENNTSKYFIGDLVVVQASKTIKKGEEVTLIMLLWEIYQKEFGMEKMLVGQVTENYHPIAMVMERDERQKDLESSYNFVCACKACANNLPTIR